MNSKKAIIVTGGAGYIGSFTTKELNKCGYSPIIIDTKPRSAWPKELSQFRGYSVNCGNPNEIFQIFRKYSPPAVIHLAALTSVQESEEKPEQYFKNNVIESIDLLGIMQKAGCRRFVFASSAAVFKEHNSPVNEDSLRTPLNVYGETKRVIEDYTFRAGKTYGLNYVVLRYFNVAGASSDGSLGDYSNTKLSIIPSLVRAFFTKRQFVIYGNDYCSPDGTATRDYVYVQDVARANVLALRHLLNNKASNTFHIGSGKGSTNLEVVREFEKIVKTKVNVVFANRRANEIGTITTTIQRARALLRWSPSPKQLQMILQTSIKHYLHFIG